jgi:hypothetical protein
MNSAPESIDRLLSVQGLPVEIVPFAFYVCGVIFVMHEVPKTDKELWFSHDCYIDVPPPKSSIACQLHYYEEGQPKWIGFHFNFPMKGGSINGAHLTLRGWNVRVIGLEYAEQELNDQAFSDRVGENSTKTWRFELTHEFCNINTLHMNEPGDILDGQVGLPLVVKHKLYTLHTFINFSLCCISECKSVILPSPWAKVATVIKPKYYTTPGATLDFYLTDHLSYQGLQISFVGNTLRISFDAGKGAMLVGVFQFDNGNVIPGAIADRPGRIEIADHEFMWLPGDMLESAGTYEVISEKDHKFYRVSVYRLYMLVLVPVYLACSKASK